MTITDIETHRQGVSTLQILKASASDTNRSQTIDAAGGPVAVGELDLDTIELTLRTPDDVRPIDRALVLLRAGGWPVGLEILPISDGELLPSVAKQLGGETASNESRRGRTDDAFSIVVCTRNRPSNLQRMLPGLIALLDDNRELIVVDNAPRDDRTAQVVAEYGDQIRYVVEPTPGLARARNCGLAAANGKFVVFTDDDVLPDPAWIDVLAATFASHPGAVAVSGSVLPTSLTTEAELRFQEFGGYQRGFDVQELHLALDPAPSTMFPFHPRLLGTGANMAFRTEALASVGGFDEALGAGTKARGGEDIDVAVRLILAGHLVIRQPAAVIWHPSHPEMDGLVRQLEDYGCGLAAAFTKFLTGRSTAPMLMRRSPAALRTLFASDSAKNDQRSADYPDDLRRAEWRGLRAGPMAYRHSRAQARRIDRLESR